VPQHDLPEAAHADAIRRALPLDHHSKAPGVVTGYWPVGWKGRTAQGERIALRIGVGDTGDALAFRVTERCWDGRLRSVRWKQFDSPLAVFWLSRGAVRVDASRADGRGVAEFVLSGEVSADARSVKGTITSTTTYAGSRPTYDQCKSGEVRFTLRA
jgi:hypothetical protein